MHAHLTAGTSIRCLLMAMLAVVIVGCSPAASPSGVGSDAASTSAIPSQSQEPVETTTPTPPYDPASILLRFDAVPDAVVDPYGDTPDGIGGNLWFVPGPDFTLYGDGTVIYRDDERARSAPTMAGRSFIGAQLSIARLTAAQVEEVLDYAWGEGGLATAKAHYPTDAVDLFMSASFMIDAGRRQKQVQLDHLDPDGGNADPEDRERLHMLAEYLRHLEAAIAPLDVQPWTPERYWASLNEVETAFTGPPTNEWPWDHIGLEGWLGGRRSLLDREVDLLGLGPIPGGYCCHLMSGPGGDHPTFSAYGLMIEPMLPDPIQVEAVSEVVTNDLVVRTAPGTDASTSEILQPTLSSPQLIYILDGPVRADGYDWYLVQPFATNHRANGRWPGGWLAAGAQDGEPWIGPTSIYCAPTNDLYAISGLSDVTRAACYGDRTLTLDGTFDGCSLRDPITYAPDSMDHAACRLLPDPYEPPDHGPLIVWFADAPSLERGQRVRIEGHFNDPAAELCAPERDADAQPNPALLVLACRAQFFGMTIERLR